LTDWLAIASRMRLASAWIGPVKVWCRTQLADAWTNSAGDAN
jgi:hypothetical protein